MKLHFKLLEHGYSNEKDMIIDEIGKPVMKFKDKILHIGDIVTLVDGKEGVVTESLIYTKKGLAGSDHVTGIVKKYVELNIGDCFLKGLVEVVV